MVYSSNLKKVLVFFAVVVFIVSLVLAIYSGVISGKVIETEVSEWTGKITYKERFDFGLFLIGFIKWIAFGCFGGGVLLALADRS